MKNIPAPIFIKGIAILDMRGKLKCCQICNGKFGLTNGEHQCKRCKRAVCDKCAAYKAIVQRFDQQSKKPHRQCNLCKEDQDNIKKFIEQYHIQFNTDTFSVQWLKTFSSDPESASKIYEEAKLKGEQSSDRDLLRAQLGVVMQEIEQMQNYSLKDFTLQVTNKEQKMKQILESVVGTFLSLNPEIGYAPEIVMIAYWLLCFSSEASAYALLTIIYANIIPSQLYPKALLATPYNYQAEASQIAGICKDTLKLQDPSLQTFAQERLSRYISQLGINFYLFESSFLIFNQIFQSNDGYADFLKYIAITISLSNQEIVKKNFPEAELFILRTTKSNQLSVGFTQLQKISLEHYAPIQRTGSIETSFYSQSSPSRLSIKEADVISQLRDQEQKQKNEITYLNDRIKKLQLQNDSLSAEVSNSRQQPEQDQRIDKLIKLNKSLQQLVDDKEEQIQKMQNNEAIQELELQKLELISQCDQLKAKITEQQSQIDQLIKDDTKKQQIIEQQANEMIFQHGKIADLEQKHNDQLQQIQAFTKSIEKLHFEIKVSKAEDNNAIVSEEIESLRAQIDSKDLTIEDLNAQIIQIQKQKEAAIKEGLQILSNEQEENQTLKKEIQNLQLSIDNLQQEYDDKLSRKKNKIQSLEEEIELLQLSAEQFERKAILLEETIAAKQILEQQVNKNKFEIESLRVQLESFSPNSDTGSSNGINTLLQQKNEEIALLTELNTNLQTQSDDQHQQLVKLQSLLKDNPVIQELKAKNEELQLQLEESEATQQTLLETLQELPQQQQQQYVFCETKINIKNKDQDDARNVIEIKNIQNNLLKGLLKENQIQVASLRETLETFRTILMRPRLSKV